MHVRLLLMLLTVTIVITTVGFLLGRSDKATSAPAEVRFKVEEEVPREKPSLGTSLRFAERSQPEDDKSLAGDQLAKVTSEQQVHPKRHDKHAPVDPIEANGEIFVDWPKPDAVLIFSGETDGYLEPCGCAGLQNQKGGLMRRHTLIKELAAQDWPVVAVDLGGQIRRFGKQAQIKFERALQSLMEIGYSAVGFGTQDLRMDLLPVVIDFQPPEVTPFVSANVAILDYDSGFTQRFKILEVGGLKIGVTSVLGKKTSLD